MAAVRGRASALPGSLIPGWPTCVTAATPSFGHERGGSMIKESDDGENNPRPHLPRVPHYLHALKRTLDRAHQSLDLLEQRLPIVDAVVSEEPFIQEALDAVRGQLLLSQVLIDSALNHCAGASTS